MKKLVLDFSGEKLGSLNRRVFHLLIISHFTSENYLTNELLKITAVFHRVSPF